MIEYWIQKSDYSSQDRKAESVDDVIRAFHEFDWASELNSFVEEDDSKNCPAGLGVWFNGDLLHICPNDKNSVFFNFHHKTHKKLFGLFPYVKNKVHYARKYDVSGVGNLIKSHMAGNVEGICAIR